MVVSKKASIGRAQAGERGHGGREVLGGEGGGERGLGGVEGGEEGLLGVGLGEAEVGVEGVFDAVLLLLLGQDVHGALVAGEEVRAVVGGEEGLQRADAGDEEDEVVLAAELEGRRRSRRGGCPRRGGGP